MIKIDCCTDHSMNEGPTLFSLMHRSYTVKEIIDRWYGAGVVYFKILANDGNIYLLKHDERQDGWDLVFYQNPEKLKALPPLAPTRKSMSNSPYRGFDSKTTFTLN